MYTLFRRYIGLAFLTILVVSSVLPVAAQVLHPKLWSGPMVGYPHPTETVIWLQTTEAAHIRIEFWPVGMPPPTYSAFPVVTSFENQFIAKVTLTGLQPNTRYEYAIFLDSQAVALPHPCTFQTPPVQPGFGDTLRIAAGSCKLSLGNIFSDPRRRRRRTMPIFNHIAERRPHLMLWLGDNVYMRSRDHGDTTRTFGRWRYERAFPTQRNLLANSHNLAILDDHDFGPNDCTGEFCYKNINVQAHLAYWANRQYGNDTLAGTFGYESWGDVDFFLTDNRFHRREYTDTAACQFGPSQLNWLLDGLAASTASFKLVLIGNQTLNSARTEKVSMNGNFLNLYPAEWQLMVDGIRQRGIRNVVFITGDRHIAEFAVLDSNSVTAMYDFTFSPLSSPGMKGFFRREGNTNRVPGSYYGHKNFGLMEITGPPGQRQLRAQIVNRRGKPVRELILRQR